MKFGIVMFPGSNREVDASLAAETVGGEVVHLWHKDHDLQGADVIILPGGFSYGDYLRAGAIARFSPIMREVSEHARRGGPVLGICNGFQILCEAHLLPGALLRNASLRFASQWVNLRVENADTLFTNAYDKGQVIRVPVAHGDGRYTADADDREVARGQRPRRVPLRGSQGQSRCPRRTRTARVDDIAGIVNERGNVLGLMPHPEDAVDPLLGSTDGLGLFESILARVAA